MASGTVSSSSSSGGGSSSVSNSGGGSKTSSTDTGSKKTAQTKSEQPAATPTFTKDGITLTAEAKTRETSNAPDMGALAAALGEQPPTWKDQLGTQTMQKGADGESVTALQSALNEKLGLSLDTDGKFGRDTLSAVKDFQQQNGLTVDGIVGKDTRAALLAEKKEAEPAKPLDANQYALLNEQLGKGTLQKGSDDKDAVTTLQNALNDRGAQLGVDGLFGNKTKQAVESFQRENGLPVNGKFDDATRAALLGPEPPKTREQLQDEEAARRMEASQPKQDDLIFGDKLTAEEQQKVRDVAASLGADPNDLMAVMAAETGGTFDPAERAGKNGAVGLIQFTNTAITEMNKGLPRDQQLTKASLEQMSFTEQMDHVQSYLQTMMDRYNGPANPDRGDLYAAVFSPALVDNSDTARIYGGNSREYLANKSLDTNRDGFITRNELTARADEWYERGLEVMV
ncbi:MAG: peptidoglycan-binding protein [Candidatus Eremiobacteraeota bacterium]|nr:peptidoglycan-binding protein [Candidatus Eremiobacteraeota bacterium]MCW5866608.1 peptidoglycan-binding protein [Candidatus Eremiobacteraeota bacterium]